MARVEISETTVYYDISGRTGRDLVRRMNGGGPRSGFMAHAIAQTWYSPALRKDIVFDRGVCRVADPLVALEIRYTYPRLLGGGSALRSRWARFMAGVDRHEKEHGKLARQMARQIDREMRRFAYRPSGTGCAMARRKLDQRIGVIWAEYDRRQNAFDADEHRRGGTVYRLVEQLVR